MVTDASFALFLIGGSCMMAPLVLSQVLRVLVRWKSPLAMELFAVPNAPLAPDWGFRLLNAKYFLPWVPAPIHMNSQPLSVRLVFWSTRATGAAFPLVMLAFFASAFLIATK
jgi:hypothetical protein